MALKLLLKSNDIKEYATVSEAGGGEGGPTTYSTKCGLIQDCSARPTEECDHLDCAIDVTIQDVKIFKALLYFSAIGFLLFILIDRSRITLWIWGTVILINLSIFGWGAYSSYKRRNELIEFKNYGTINGIKASKL